MKTSFVIFSAACIAFSGGISLVCIADTGDSGTVTVISPAQVRSLPSAVTENPVQKYEGSIPIVKPDSSIVYKVQIVKPDPKAGYSLKVVGKSLPENPGDVSKQSSAPAPDTRTIPVESQEKPIYQ